MIRHSTGYKGVLTAIVMVVVVLAYAPMIHAEGVISQGFRSQDELTIGMLVSRGDATGSVEAASSDSSDQLVGVVNEQALLEISDDDKQVQVATTGTVEALVSTMNGEVKAGDRLAPSPLDGIGMRATESGYVVGSVMVDFSEARSVSEKQIVDKDGNSHTIKVGLLPVRVDVAYYEKPNENKSLLPDFISNLARTIAGREVSPVRVIAAAAVLAVGMSVVVVLISSTARSSIISIGRNPLAAKAVHRGLLEASGLAIGILLVMLIAVYLVLVI